MFVLYKKITQQALRVHLYTIGVLQRPYMSVFVTLTTGLIISKYQKYTSLSMGGNFTILNEPGFCKTLQVPSGIY